MSSPKRWTVIDSEPLADCRVFSVSRIQSRSPTTQRCHSFYRIDARPWVNVVPITPEGDVVMVRQYRHGTGEITLETPGGIVDPGETPVEAAARELLEETGYRATEFVGLAGLSPNPALFTNRLHAFVARGVQKVSPIRNGETEETLVEIVSRERLRRKIAQGSVDHALVVAVLHQLDLHERYAESG